MTEIIHENDNVVPLVLRPRAGLNLNVSVKVLHFDEEVILARVTLQLDNQRCLGTEHIMVQTKDLLDGA